MVKAALLGGGKPCVYPVVERLLGVVSPEPASLLLSPLEERVFLSALPPRSTHPLLLGAVPVRPPGGTEKVMWTRAQVSFRPYPPLFFATGTLLSSNCVLTRICNVNSTACLVEIGEFVSTFGHDYIPSSSV